jgi:hypothetical protein
MIIMTRRPSWRVVTLTALLLTAGGCSKKLPAPPKTYVVAGKVTLPNGEPCRGGAVHFDNPENSSFDGKGVIGADGAYSASVFQRQAGLMPGEYKVWVEPYGRGTMGPLEGTPTPIPKALQTPETSGLTFTVKEQENTFNIELK